MRLLRRALVLLLAVTVVGLAGGAAYFSIPQPNLPEAAAALASNDAVTYSREDDRYVFTPAGPPPVTGLILYPGGKVDPIAYAPTARHLAELGYLVEIVPMPLNLAVLGIDRASAVVARHPEVERWAIGGHSLGGAMAAQYVAGHPGRMAGLVLWAAYSASKIPTPVPTLLVYGTLDTGIGSYTSDANVGHLGLPPTVVVVDGGNHQQMGWYTGQPNDPPATLAREEQQRRVIEATARFLAGLEP
jgi:dienelactone hydrolase